MLYKIFFIVLIAYHVNSFKMGPEQNSTGIARTSLEPNANRKVEINDSFEIDTWTKKKVKGCIKGYNFDAKWVSSVWTCRNLCQMAQNPGCLSIEWWPHPWNGRYYCTLSKYTRDTKTFLPNCYGPYKETWYQERL